MQWRRTISEEELVGRLRRNDRHRYRVGLMMAVGGLSMLLIASGLFTWSLFHWTPFADSGPTALRFEFVFGLVLGALLSGVVHHGGHLVAQGLAMAFMPDRRTALLLRLWDDAHREDFV